MRIFFKPIDKRSRKEMTHYLLGHFRYNTMNHWNRSTSYACDLKIHHLDLEQDITNKLYDMIQIDEFYYSLNDLMRAFSEEHNQIWQVGMNGRSRGYLVLYQGELKSSGYQSYCTICGQQNYTAIKETGTICGVCHNPSRVDYSQKHMYSSAFPGRSTDMYEDFMDWEMNQLKERVELVQDLDRLADRMVQEAVYLAENMDIKEESYFVERQRKILVEINT